MTALGTLGLRDRAFVYGFDEIDASCEPSVRALFSAAKAAFPGLRTMSAIDWATVPLDMPLDVWVIMYQLVNTTTASAWVNAGHEIWTYHCIEPSGAGYLNTFVERQLIEARLLFWFDWQLGVTGHLYYDVALWASWSSVPPFWTDYTTQSGVSFALPPLPIGPRALGPADDPRLTTWDPANWIWAPRTDIWANGDGQFVYPGSVDGATRVGTPISSLRFETQRDGVEDWHVLAEAAAVDAASTEQLVRTRVSAPTTWSNDAVALEAARRAAAAIAMGASRSAGAANKGH